MHFFSESQMSETYISALFILQGAIIDDVIAEF
jgi:hypothetical protein